MGRNPISLSGQKHDPGRRKAAHELSLRLARDKAHLSKAQDRRDEMYYLRRVAERRLSHGYNTPSEEEIRREMDALRRKREMDRVDKSRRNIEGMLFKGTSAFPAGLKRYAGAAVEVTNPERIVLNRLYNALGLAGDCSIVFTESASHLVQLGSYGSGRKLGNGTIGATRISSGVATYQAAINDDKNLRIRPIERKVVSNGEASRQTTPNLEVDYGSFTLATKNYAEKIVVFADPDLIMKDGMLLFYDLNWNIKTLTLSPESGLVMINGYEDFSSSFKVKSVDSGVVSYKLVHYKNLGTVNHNLERMHPPVHGEVVRDKGGLVEKVVLYGINHL